jgi:hypothetical protein
MDELSNVSQVLYTATNISMVEEQMDEENDQVCRSDEGLSQIENIDTTSFFTREYLQRLVGQRFPGFFRITTPGLNGTWYSPPKLWISLESYPVPKICFSDQDFELRQIIGNLIERVKQLDQLLYDDIKASSTFLISRAAFRVSLTASNNTDVRWQKDYFIPLLLDRLLWVEYCIAHPNDRPPPPFQTPHDTYRTPDSSLQDLAELELGWPSVIRQFTDEWRRYSSTDKAKDVHNPLKSLYEGIERSDNHIYAAKVTRTFCTIALAIRSLLIVSLVNNESSLL